MLPLWTQFFDDLQHVRGRSQNTIMAYRRDLELFAEFQKTQGPIGAFYEFMRQQNLSARSQARVISSLRTYSRFCDERGEKFLELSELRPPKVKVGLPKILSQDEFNRLFEAAKTDEPIKAARNQMTLLLLYGLGCRVSELIGLNLDDYNETDRWMKILGKGGKERLVPLTEHLATELGVYLREVRSFLLKSDKTTSLLVNDRGHRPSRVDIWRWLAAWSEKAGFDEPVGPHRFRHACATALLESGADLRSIQMLLGHASLQTTQIYTSVTSSNLVRTVEEHHPLSQTALKDQEP